MTEGRPAIARTVVLGLLALALAVQVVRAAVVGDYLATRPELAARLWPAHPNVILATTMGNIGRSAAEGAGARREDVEAAMVAARRSPLAIEPLLIAGAQAVVDRRPLVAEQLFQEARRRDPRSAAARYFLAQRYLSTGRISAGLSEAVVLSRLVPGGTGAMLPGLVQLAHAPGSAARLRQVIVSDPVLGAQLVAMLAADPANTALVLQLASALPPPPPGTVRDWPGRLIEAQIKAGNYTGARALWARLSGLPVPPNGLFNPQFATIAAPAPFNWSLAAGSFGVAEPTAAGLQIIYYGRDDGAVAQQLLVLKSGVYQLRMIVRRGAAIDQPSALVWSVTCQPGSTKLLTMPLPSAAGARSVSGQFTVPAGCPAQALVLGATAPEFAANEEVTISSLELMPGSR